MVTQMFKRSLWVSLCLLCIACANQKPHEGVPLVWRPTSSTMFGVVSLEGLSGVTLAVRPFSDNRSDRQAIGKNIEHLPVIKPVTTKDNVAAFCTEHFADLLKKQGLRVSATGNVIITGEVVEFFVTEDNNYTSHVGVRITAADRNGKLLWEGMLAGHAQRFGRSYSMENYYETLSDALIDGVQHLIEAGNFTSSLRGAGKG